MSPSALNNPGPGRAASELGYVARLAVGDGESYWLFEPVTQTAKI